MENKKITISELERNLWNAADSLRGNLSAEDYMHVVLGILTLKYINDKYEKTIKYFVEEIGRDYNTIDQHDLISEGAFFVPEKSKWSYILKFVGTNEIGFILDEAIVELGKENEDLNGVFTSEYNNEDIDKTKLGEVVKIFNDTNMANFGEDILGRVYEYFLGEFALKRGQKGGEFYTPKPIVRLITSMIKPIKGKIYDPACGMGGMLVQAKQYIEDKKGNINNISIFGQEWNSTTWRLAKLNLILHSFNIVDVNGESVLGEKAADSFTNDQHKGKEFDFIMANPPFNLKKYWNESLENDNRWKEYRKPPEGNANYAWLMHILNKMSPYGKAGVVLANGSLTSSGNDEQEIRKLMIMKNKISCIVLLPEKLFYTTDISASIWFFDNDKKDNNKILFIDAQELGELIEGSKKKTISDENIDKIVSIYDEFNLGKDINIPGLAKSIDIKTIEENDFTLLPGNYIEISNDTNSKSEEEIKKELKENIEELKKLIDESKELEKSVFEAIKKLDIN